MWFRVEFPRIGCRVWGLGFRKERERESEREREIYICYSILAFGRQDPVFFILHIGGF